MFHSCLFFPTLILNIAAVTATYMPKKIVVFLPAFATVTNIFLLYIKAITKHTSVL